MSNNLQGIIGFIYDTKSNLENSTLVIPEAAPCWESDTGNMKIGNGQDIYSDLNYTIYNLSQDQIELFTNAGSALGLIVYDEDGYLPIERMYGDFLNQVLFVENIDMRNYTAGGLSENEIINEVLSRTYNDGNLATFIAVENIGPQALVFVEDASADPTVDQGSALYAYDFTEEQWVKLYESEIEIQVNNFVTMDKLVLDNFNDTSSYVKMTPLERTTLSNLNANVVKLNTPVMIVSDNWILDNPTTIEEV